MQSPMKRRLLVRRGATDPLVDVCRNRRSIINRSRNEACAINRFTNEQSNEYSGGREARSAQRVGREEHVERVEGVVGRDRRTFCNR